MDIQLILQFVAFLTVFISGYGVMSWYFYRKTVKTFELSPKIKMIIRIMLMIMWLILVLIMTPARGTHTAMVWLSFIAYTWLVVLFLFLCWGVFFDELKWILFKLHKKMPRHHRFCYYVQLAIPAFVIVYGSFEAMFITTDYIFLTTPKLQEREKLRILQLSDVHFSPLTGIRFANKIKEIIDAEKPDMILMTGDMLDRGIREKEEIIALFAAIQPPCGKYAITGNHEFYYGIEEAEAFFAQAGFSMLRNKSEVRCGIQLAGIDNKHAKRFSTAAPKDHQVLKKLIHHTYYTIFLKHQPQIDEDNDTRYFDLMLSGHTHAGQVFPFSLFTKIAYPLHAGLYTIANDAKVYVSRGTGTWGPPFRFLASPEITVIELQRSAAPSP